MQTSLPDDALLARYAVADDGEALPHYTDCFTTQVEYSLDLTTYVRTFYTTPLFRCERFVLRLLGMGSTDADIDALLAGEQTHFAAWTQEDRSDDQLLMCDVHARTRSWFRVVPEDGGTRLYFGSAVVIDGEQMRAPFRAMIPMHRLYSRQLLRAATRRLKAHQATH